MLICLDLSACMSEKPISIADISEAGEYVAGCDLVLFLFEAEDTLNIRFEYDSALFASASIERLLDKYRILLKNISDDSDRRISELPLLTDAEQIRLLETWNETPSDYPKSKCVHQLFEDQARLTPDAVALVFYNQHIGYGELNCRANQIAHHLLALGIGPGVPVGVYLERSPEMVIALLAVLKAGGAYLPLDPTYPQERIRFMLQDAAAPVVITSEPFLEHLSADTGHIVCMERAQATFERQSVNDPVNRTSPDQPVNIIYTSGSTGVPKGVEVLHRGITRLVFGNNYVHFGPEEVFLQMAPMSFDASTFELWGALLHGGTCVIYPESIPSTGVLAEVISKHGVTTLWLTSTLFNAIIDEAADILMGVRQLLTGGEALSVAHVRKALERLPNTRLINGYGPTESTTFTCCYNIPRSLDPNLSSIPIGRPIGNTRVYLLNAGMQPVPVGVAGELYIGGDGLARGYHNRPDLTAKSFVSDPFSLESEAKLYRTGDLARYLPDGNIEFLGRIDEQIKIRGFRIEPEEIEAALKQHHAVREAVILAREDKPGDMRLVAYVVLDQEQTSPASELCSFLKQKLPDYMVPAAFVFLDVMPLTPNGKLDRRSLPAQDPHIFESARPRVAPRTALELALASIWCDILKCTGISVHDNFFLLGGHSLLVTQMVARMRSQFRIDLPIRAIFEAPTIARLAALIEPLQPVLVDAQPTGIPRIPRTSRSPGTNTMGIDRIKK